MSGDVHVRFCESVGVRFPCATRLLACFQYQEDAENFHASLNDRLEGFNLKLAEEKTRRIAFGRYARENAHRNEAKPQDFDFLGFTFYCGKTRYGHFKVKRKTSRKKLQQSLSNFADWLRRFRNLMPTGQLVRKAKARIRGYLNYYAVTDNTKHCDLYMHLTMRILFKWLNRRSQLKSYTWKGFNQMLSHIGWPRVRIQVNLNPFSSTPNV